MSLQLFDLTGRLALITGSSKGIGFAIAGGLAAVGAQIVLNGRDGDALEKARAGLAAKGYKVHARAVPGSEARVQAAPLGRWGTCAEVADSIAYLLGEGASYLTGQTLDVNGGMT